MENVFVVCYKQDNLKLYIGEDTGEVFADVEALALMCNVSQQAIIEWQRREQISTIETNFHTTLSFQEDAIVKAFVEFNMDAVEECCMNNGIREYLHVRAGLMSRYELGVLSARINALKTKLF